jgi:hypothetical protein
MMRAFVSSLLVPSLLVLAAPALHAAPPKRASAFQLHNGFWMNLNDALYNEAHGSDSTGEPKIVPLEPRLSGAEQAVWHDAVDVYRRTIGKMEYARDEELNTVLDAVAAVDDGAPLASAKLRPILIAALRDAAPIYRKHDWPATRRLNAQRLEEARKRLPRYEARMFRRLDALYREPLHRPARFDFVRYAMWAGAYTRIEEDGTSATIFASSNEAQQGAHQVEIFFHEASHAVIFPHGGAVIKAINAQCKTVRDFWHVLLFYTVGAVAKENFGPSYVPTADGYGLYKIPGWDVAHEVLVREWQPYIDGKRSFEDAVAGICRPNGGSKP